MSDDRVTTSLDYEGARALAQRIFEIYDKDKSGVIESYEIKGMLVDTYKSINKVIFRFTVLELIIIETYIIFLFINF